MSDSSESNPFNCKTCQVCEEIRIPPGSVVKGGEILVNRENGVMLGLKFLNS